MTDSISLQFANGRIKSLENNLLNADKITRMLDCPTLEEAVKILAESNYGGGAGIDNPKNFDRVLESEERNVTDFIRSLLVAGYGIECLLLKNDYHNAKVFAKLKYSRQSEASHMLKPRGILDTDKLGDGMRSDNYGAFPAPMANAAMYIDTAFANGERSPRLIDVTFDKAYFEDVAERLAAAKKSVIKDYFVKLIDFTNISSFFRCKRAGMALKLFEQSFIEGGRLKRKTLTPLYESSAEVIAEAMRYGGYYKAFERIIEDKQGALIRFEAYSDNALLSIFKAERHNMFSPSPIAGYYLGKLAEIKMAKLVLVGINNNVDRAIIRQRLRELYA